MDPDSERLFQEQTRALEAVNEALRNEQQRLEAELDATDRIENIVTQLTNTLGSGELYEQILDAAEAILHADFASIQMFYPERGSHGELRLLGHRGFSEETAKRWEWVRLTTQTSCGEALRSRQRVVVPDVQTCDFLTGSDELDVYVSAGIKAVQTTPLMALSGSLVGMVSTHWREPREPAASELRALDVLVRLAADVIEYSRLEEVLRENQQHLASIYDSVKDVIFHLVVEPEGQFRFLSVNAAFLKVTGLSQGMVVGKTVNEVIPEPSLTMVLGKYRQAIEEQSSVVWEETSDYPTGRLTGEVSIVPVFDAIGVCTHLVGSVHDITARRAAEKALAHSEQQLRALTARLLSAQEDERRRVARELHDDVTQRLAFLSIELGKLVGEIPDSLPEMRMRIRGLQEQTRRASTEVRRVSHGLHPSEIEDFGLSIALEEFCGDYAMVHRIGVPFEGFIEDAHLSRDGATCLYRIVQESLRNATVHGGATEVSVELTADAENIYLRVRDNGVGFTTGNARSKTGLGVVSMQERIRLVNGTMTLSSQPGQGTEIVASVPLNAVRVEKDSYSAG